MHYQSARSCEMNGEARLRTPQTTVLPFTRKMIHVAALQTCGPDEHVRPRAVFCCSTLRLFRSVRLHVCMSACLHVCMSVSVSVSVSVTVCLRRTL